MRALSIRQPWAWLILHGGKDVENRTWCTNYRGLCLIHAAKGCTRREYDEAKAFANAIEPDLMLPPLAALERGGIVGEVQIVGCVAMARSPWFVGPWGLLLANAKELPFQPLPGALNFFEVYL